jgi:hypothetical protein
VEKRWRDTKAALGEERRMRRAAERQAAEAQGAFEAQMRALAEGTGQGAPNAQTDPRATLEWVQQRILQADAWEAERRGSIAAERREAAEIADLTREFQDAEADIREMTPDYDEAVGFMRQSRIDDLVGLGCPQQRAVEIFRREAIETLRAVRAHGIDPARFAYALARENGFRGKGIGTPKGHASPPSVSSPAFAAASFAPPYARAFGELTYESVAALSGKAFDAAFKQFAAQERERERRL